MVWRSQMQQALVSSQARSSPSRLAARADQSAQAFGPGLLALTSYAALSLLACGLHAWLNRAGASMHYHGVSRSWCVIFSVCYTHKVHTSAHASTHTDTRTHMHTHTHAAPTRARAWSQNTTHSRHTPPSPPQVSLLFSCIAGQVKMQKLLCDRVAMAVVFALLFTSLGTWRPLLRWDDSPAHP